MGTTAVPPERILSELEGAQGWVVCHKTKAKGTQCSHPLALKPQTGSSVGISRG